MENTSRARIIWAIIAVIVVVVLVFVMPDGSSETPNEQENVAEIEVKTVDLEKLTNEDEKRPDGFPKDIPVTSQNIVESYSSEYKDRGYTQHTVAYDTRDTVSSLFALYETYFISAGYEITASSEDSDLATVSGTKNGDDLTVVLTTRGDASRATISYLDRE